MPLGSFRAFKFEKNSFYEEKCKTFTNWKSKKRYQQINFVKNISEVEVLFWAFGISSNVIICRDNGHEMQTSFKTLVLKNVAHGVCTKSLCNDKFV